MGYSLYLNPVLASCHEIIVQKRQRVFPHHFVTFPYNHIYFVGYLKRYLQRYFNYIYSQC